ncbi:helix-turn-helix domain-containing protein [Acholeplasma hippikon]|nr:helix-turn-helix transcriptional regulator [Acholeplasma hippikon]
MYIYLKSIKHQINMRKHEPLYRNEIGSILKNLRKQHHLTLEEGAEGICSVSYLSKVENNMIIPNSRYLDLFKEKYKIDFSSQKNNINFNEVIHLFLEKDKVKFFEFNNHLDYQSILNNYLGYILLNQLSEANQLFEEVTHYIKNYDQDELALYLYGTSILLKEEGRLKDAFNVLTLMNEKVSHKELNLLIDKEKLILSFFTNDHGYILLHYDVVINRLVNLGLYEDVNEMKFLHLNYLMQFMRLDEFLEELAEASYLKHYEKTYLKAKINYLNQRYEDSYKLIIGKERLNQAFYLLSLQIMNKLKYKENIFELINHPYEKLNKNEELAIKYLKYKFLNQKEEQLSFIREQILKQNDFPDTQDLLNFWYEEGMENLRKNNYYKEASSLSDLIFKKYKNLRIYID